MQIELIPTIVNHFRESFEGEPHPGAGAWITDGKPESAVFGTIETLTWQEAFALPAPGARSCAAHAEHLRFSLDLMSQRMQGEDPKANWAASFDVPEPSAQAWDHLRSELHRAYHEVLTIIQKQQRDLPAKDWPAFHIAGLSALTAHNAYHLGALRQIARVVKHVSPER